MNKIYLEISNLSKKFRKMCYGLTKDKKEVDDSVQELMLYFLQMNPDTLKKIYDKDGLDGITRYGAVVLRRSLTSTRSPFFYKYKKYYTNLSGMNYITTSSQGKAHQDAYHKSIYNMPEEVVENIGFQNLDKIDAILGEMYWYDRKVFELYYYEDNTLDSLAKKTGISRNSLFTTIDKVREILRKELADE
jgi:DNA-directed RNA polymerase specialized sigma24 family protein